MNIKQYERICLINFVVTLRMDGFLFIYYYTYANNRMLFHYLHSVIKCDLEEKKIVKNHKNILRLYITKPNTTTIKERDKDKTLHTNKKKEENPQARHMKLMLKSIIAQKACITYRFCTCLRAKGEYSTFYM
uniref:Uncharacterized protein n=1 Tax=Glossina brevipalpis TaxID=37001 RepID=A0A1A9WIC1_9MUSC